MDQAVSIYSMTSQLTHRLCALASAREAIERRGAVWYAVYRTPGVLLCDLSTAELDALADLANSRDWADNTADPRVRKHVEAARRRYAVSRAAHRANRRS